jgi:hypothetical protein
LDLVGAGSDAGIHFGEFVERDMVAVRVSWGTARGDRRRAQLHCVAPETEIGSMK